MSLFDEAESGLRDLLSLEEKRIANHGRIIKVYPEGSPAAIENKRLQDEALKAEACVDSCLKKVRFIARACRNQAPPNYEQPLREIVLRLKQAKLYRSKLFEAEGMITQMYDEVVRLVGGARV